MRRIRFYLSVFILFYCACLLFYYNSIKAPFIWDDNGLILSNGLIKSFSFFKHALTSDLFTFSLGKSNFYRPLQTLSYMWDYHFWQLNPLGYHLTNILLQAAASFLVFVFLLKLLKKKSLAFSAALLFALCPLATESVTYISGRAEMLMAIFLLSSLICFIESNESGPQSRYMFLFFSLLSFSLGLLAKELAVVLPLIILAYSRLFLKARLKSKFYFIINIFPFLIIDAVYVILRFSYFSFPTLWRRELTGYPLLVRLSVLPQTILIYLKLLIFPVGLHMSWTVPRPLNPAGLYFSIFLVVSITAALVYLFFASHLGKKPLFLVFWGLVFFIPQSGILPINSFLAEHFIYLSSISFFVAIIYLMRKYLSRVVFVFCVAGITLYYGLLTRARNYEWRDPVIFYKALIKLSPSSAYSHNNLGVEYLKRNEFELAITEFRKALELRDDRVNLRSNLANVYFKMNNYDQSIKEYLRVEKEVPWDKAGELENNIGVLYQSKGDFDMALKRYALALKLDRGLRFTHFNIARIYFMRKDLQAAAGEIALSLSRNNLSFDKNQACLQLVREYLVSGKSFRWNFSFFNSLGVKFAQAGLVDAGINSFLNALELNPNNPDVHFNLGLAYWNKGLKQEAAVEFRQVLKINPKHEKAKRMLGSDCPQK